MRLWLERFVLTICAAVVISLTILNPLRLDWQQRISLALAVSAFAYFIGHTIHKPAAPVPADPRITFLEEQVRNLQSQQQQFAVQEANKDKERTRRYEVKKQLSVFIEEGRKIAQGLEYNNPSTLHDKAAWEKRVAEYLAQNLDESYAVRFRNPSHQVTSYPMGISRGGSGMMGPWGEVTTRMQMLNDFISELRD